MAKIKQGKDIVLFVYSGKTFIGKLWNQQKIQGGVFTEGSVIGTMIGKSPSQISESHYAISNPCQVVFQIITPGTGSPQLKWTLKPIFYKKLHINTSSDVHFVFPKNEVCLSNVCSQNMNEELFKAYNQIVGII